MQSKGMVINMIRKASLHDIDKIINIDRQLIKRHCDMDPKTFKMPDEEFYYNSLLKAIESDEKEIFVFEDETIKGYAMVTESIRDIPIKIRKKVCLIDELAVDENYRNEGIGTELLNYIKSYVNNKKLDVLEICVRAENENAYKLYERCGFEPQLITMEVKLKTED